MSYQQAEALVRREFPYFRPEDARTEFERYHNQQVTDGESSQWMTEELYTALFIMANTRAVMHEKNKRKRKVKTAKRKDRARGKKMRLKRTGSRKG